jgi:nicotinamide-nucleotide amidase
MVKKAVGQEELSPRQIKQATIPAGSQVLEPVGTSPGFVIICESSVVMVLPGVPLEMKKMWGYACHNPQVAAVLNAAPSPFRRALAFYGPGESQVAEAVQSILGKSRAGLEVSICCRYQEVLLELTGSPDSQDQVENLTATLKQRFGNAVYSGGEKIEEVIAAELSRQGKTLAVGESCTGGMLGEVITSISGASAFFLGGVIAYSNNVKRDLLKVRQETLDNVGAVSEPVAQQLALGVRALSGADYGIGITGVAGPTGGTPAKPVGLVYICVSSDKGDVVKGFNFPGQRSDVRQAAVTTALHMLHQKLLIDKEDTPYNA